MQIADYAGLRRTGRPRKGKTGIVGRRPLLRRSQGYGNHQEDGNDWRQEEGNPIHQDSDGHQDHQAIDQDRQGSNEALTTPLVPGFMNYNEIGRRAPEQLGVRRPDFFGCPRLPWINYSEFLCADAPAWRRSCGRLTVRRQFA